MNLWKTYTHCRSSSDPDEIRIDAQRLDLAAHAVELKSQSPIVLPVAMQHLVSKLPSRLAVDPNAMAMDCALYGGQVARAVGRPRLAVELFNVVLTKREEAAYGYYVSEATRGLGQMGPDMHFIVETSAGVPGPTVKKAIEEHVGRVRMVNRQPQRLMSQIEPDAHVQEPGGFYHSLSMRREGRGTVCVMCRPSPTRIPVATTAALPAHR